MRTLFYNARLVDPATDRDEPGGLCVEDGRIADIGPHLSGANASDGTLVIDCDGDVLLPGLIDLRVSTGEPGAEHTETLESASAAAVAGGITSMIVMPSTRPAINSPALVDYLARAARSSAIVNRIYPAGALTVGLAGEHMAELALMKEAGAVFFTQAGCSLASAAVAKRALGYASALGLWVALQPGDPSLRGGAMNAGAFAARLGLKGMPPHAEWIGLSRDLMLAEATGASLLVDQLTTARSLDIVSRARANGARVAVTVAAHHLVFNELDIGDGSHDPDKAYLTYCKVDPPFRSEADRLALVDALKHGRIDAVVSAHDPQPAEAKRLPFEDASFGAAGLETLLSTLTSLVADPAYGVSCLAALRAVTSGPAGLLGLEQGRLAIGAPADLVRIDLDKPWKCRREDLRSKSTNSPYDGRLLTGQAIQTMVNGRIVFDRLAERRN